MVLGQLIRLTTCCHETPKKLMYAMKVISLLLTLSHSTVWQLIIFLFIVIPRSLGKHCYVAVSCLRSLRNEVMDRIVSTCYDAFGIRACSTMSLSPSFLTRQTAIRFYCLVYLEGDHFWIQICQNGWPIMKISDGMFFAAQNDFGALCVEVIKLFFSSSPTLRQNKLKCLSLVWHLY